MYKYTENINILISMWPGDQVAGWLGGWVAWRWLCGRVAGWHEENQKGSPRDARINLMRATPPSIRPLSSMFDHMRLPGAGCGLPVAGRTPLLARSFGPP